jgi:hypothetical protein
MGRKHEGAELRQRPQILQPFLIDVFILAQGEGPYSKGPLLEVVASGWNTGGAVPGAVRHGLEEASSVSSNGVDGARHGDLSTSRERKTLSWEGASTSKSWCTATYAGVSGREKCGASGG